MAEIECPKCGNTEVKYLYTTEDWFDGDEEDVYECVKCEHVIRIYIPR